MEDRYELLIGFLKNKGLLEKYGGYLKEDKLIPTEHIDDCIKDMKPIKYIFEAFDWYKTDEGFDFWEKVHGDWIWRLKLTYRIEKYNKPKLIIPNLNSIDKLSQGMKPEDVIIAMTPNQLGVELKDSKP